MKRPLLHITLLMILMLPLLTACGAELLGVAIVSGTRYMMNDMVKKPKIGDGEMHVKVDSALIIGGNFSWNVHSEVEDGRVRLYGTVPSYVDVQKAITLAYGVPGVEEVESEIAVIDSNYY